MDVHPGDFFIWSGIGVPLFVWWHILIPWYKVAGNDVKYSITNKYIDEETGFEYNEVTDRNDWGKVLNRKDFGIFYSVIGEADVLNYKGFQKSAEGDIIVAVGNKLIYHDGNYQNPAISKVIVFNDNDETNIDIARRAIYDYENQNIPFEECAGIVNRTLGYGYIREYDARNHRGFRQETGRGKGSDSSETIEDTGNPRDRGSVESVERDLRGEQDREIKYSINLRIKI